MNNIYHLKTKNNANLTNMCVWCEQYGINDYRIKFDFVINFSQAYGYARILQHESEEFVEHLSNLQARFYDFIVSSIERKIIPSQFNKTDVKVLFGAWDMTYNKLMDYFLPLQQDFASRWGLVVSQD